MFATCMCARYHANEYHVSAVKKIFHYLKGTINLGLWYPKDSGFDLTAYSDADHAGCHLDRKSTSGSVQFLGDKLVYWSSKKQNCVSISTAESEYVDVSGCCAQVLWMRTQLTDYGFFYDKVPIYCDSKSAIEISCNPVQHTRTKRIDVSYIEYALTVNPTIYVSCIKQFWKTDDVKQSNDVTRLQAIVDKKKVVVTEAAIRDVLHLDDAEGVDCLPNEEIFTELARMGYEKPSTKLTFYKAFFSSQWKFLIHTILQSMSAKRTSWNEFSSTMASAVICLSTGCKFNFSKYIFDSLVRNVDSSSKFYMYPRFIHLIIQNQLGDLSTHTTKYISLALTQKVFANMRRVGKGCFGVETPLFEGMLVAREPEEQGDAEEQNTDDNAAEEPDTAVSKVDEALDASAALARRVEHLRHDKVARDLEIIKLKTRVKKLERANKVKTLKLRRLRKVGTSQIVDTLDDTDMKDVSNQGRMIDELDRDEGVVLKSEKEEKKEEEVKDITGNIQINRRQADIYQIDMDHAAKVLSMQEDESEVQEAEESMQKDESKVHEVVEVVTTAKLITEVVASISETISAIVVVPTAVSETVSAVAVVLAAVSEIVSVAAVVPTVTAAPIKVSVPFTRRRRGVVIWDPAKESSAKTPTETKSKDKGKGIMVEEPKPMKKKQQVELDEAYTRKLHEELNHDIDWEVAIDHNTAGFRLDNFKGMSYDDIRPIFEAKFNANMEFLLKSKEQKEKETNRALESINETPAQKAAKRRRRNEEVKDVEEIKQHLEIVLDEDDDVYTEATPLAKKVPVVYYQIVHFNNKPHYKIIRVDGTHQLYVSFITLLKNFDREDLESLWSLVKEKFFTSKSNNFSDDYLLTILKAMFGRPDGQDLIWKSQRSVHGQAMVKSWKLLESCGVHIISFTTTQLILLVERRYPLSRFTLDQMLNTMRLQVEE
uniref:Uncharacterized mitochondrial protein AtMg00810-like n=1 Tax=Tanacetum cinerariifolium TaxID=118510 RepID=A0A6L2JTE3_TANCI|nr:uncharacterized mitochondrial protein AtMg00810-like [Tanacetum cinerariifolium]